MDGEVTEVLRQLEAAALEEHDGRPVLLSEHADARWRAFRRLVAAVGEDPDWLVDLTLLQTSLQLLDGRPTEEPATHAYRLGERVVTARPSDPVLVTLRRPDRDVRVVLAVAVAAPLSLIIGLVDLVYGDEPDHVWVSHLGGEVLAAAAEDRALLRLASQLAHAVRVIGEALADG